jgi:hypothetical protein
MKCVRRSPPVEGIVLACAAFALFVAYALMVLLPGESFGRVGAVETVTINAWRGHFYVLALASSVAACAASLWAMRSQRRWTLWLLFFAGLGSPLICCSGTFDDLGGFHDAGYVRDKDGTEYHLLKSAFLQGAQLALARLRSRVGPLEEYEVLVESPWEESFGFLAVVRPQASTETELYLTEDRMLVGVPHGNMAFLAYDLTLRKAYSQIYNVNEHGYADMRELSPFLLLGSDDVPRESDFKSLMKPKSFGRPYPQAVQKDLTSPNVGVRELARRLLADLRAHPAER